LPAPRIQGPRPRRRRPRDLLVRAAREQIAAGQCQAAGLVATNSIRGGANRKVLDRIVASTRIFEAWSDEPWVNEGRQCVSRSFASAA
jgi:hypothetical protein